MINSPCSRFNPYRVFFSAATMRFTTSRVGSEVSIPIGFSFQLRRGYCVLPCYGPTRVSIPIGFSFQLRLWSMSGSPTSLSMFQSLSGFLFSCDESQPARCIPHHTFQSLSGFLFSCDFFPRIVAIHLTSFNPYRVFFSAATRSTSQYHTIGRKFQSLSGFLFSCDADLLAPAACMPHSFNPYRVFFSAATRPRRALPRRPSCFNPYRVFFSAATSAPSSRWGQRTPFQSLSGFLFSCDLVWSEFAKYLRTKFQSLSGFLFSCDKCKRNVYLGEARVSIPIGFSFQLRPHHHDHEPFPDCVSIPIGFSFQLRLTSDQYTLTAGVVSIPIGFSFQLRPGPRGRSGPSCRRFNPYRVFFSAATHLRNRGASLRNTVSIPIGFSFQLRHLFPISGRRPPCRFNPYRVFFSAATTEREGKARPGISFNPYRVFFSAATVARGQL